MDGADLIRVMDDDLGVLQFMEITKDDITATGKLRPIGARHFAMQATIVQNISNFYQSAVGQDPAVRAHISGKAVAKLFEEYLGVERFGLFQENVRVDEESETAALVQESQMQLQEREKTPLEPELPPEVEAMMRGQG